MIIVAWFGKRMLLAWVLAALALVSLQLSFDVLETLRLSDRVGSWPAAQALLLNIPSRLNDYYPYIWLTTVLIAIGELSKSGALTVLRVSGMSTARLLGLVLTPMLLTTMLWVWFYDSVGLAMRAQSETITSGSQPSNSLRSLWLNEGERFIHIGSSNGRQLQQILIADTDLASSKLKRVVTATSAVYAPDTQNWRLRDVKLYTVADDESMRAAKVEDLTWNFPLSASILLNLANEPSLVSLSKLWALDGYLQNLNGGANEFSLELWRRLTLPFYVCTLGLLALALVSSFARSSSLGARVFLALSLTIATESANRLLGALFIQLNLTALYALLLGLALNLALGYYLWRRGSG